MNGKTKALTTIFVVIFVTLTRCYGFSLFLYLQLTGRGNSFTIKTITANNRTVPINRTFKASDRQNQFFVSFLQLHNGTLSSIKINGKSYPLPENINLKKNRATTIFIVARSGKVSLKTQNLMRVKNKVLFTLPEKKVIGVIDADTGLVAGFIKTPFTPSGIAIANSIAFVGHKNAPIISAMSVENGFPLFEIPSSGTGTERIETNRNRLYVLDAAKKTISICDTSTHAIKTLTFPEKASDFFIDRNTGTILVVDGKTGNINMFSATNGNQVGTIMIPGSINSICGDGKNIYATDSFGKLLVKYSLISRTTEVEELMNNPEKVRNYRNLIFVITPESLIAFDSFSLSPYAYFNIKKISELLFTNDKIFTFSKTGKYFVIDSSSLYTEKTGEIPGAVFQANTN